MPKLRLVKSWPVLGLLLLLLSTYSYAQSLGDRWADLAGGLKIETAFWLFTYIKQGDRSLGIAVYWYEGRG